MLSVFPMPARLGQRASVAIVRVEDGPSRVAEGGDREDVAQEPCRLGVVDVKLALVARCSCEGKLGVSSPQLWQLPSAGGLAAGDSAEVLGVLHQRHHAPASSFAVLRRDDGSDGEVDEFVAISEPPAVRGRALRWKAPRMVAVAHWLWRLVVRPGSSGPSPARGREDDEIVVPRADPCHQHLLRVFAQQVVRGSTHVDVDFVDLQADPLVLAKLQ